MFTFKIGYVFLVLPVLKNPEYVCVQITKKLTKDYWEQLSTFGCLGQTIAYDIISQQKVCSLFHGKLSEPKVAFDYA